MKEMIWKVFGGSWRCSNCLTMPMCKDITDMKYCPNCGAKAIAYETDVCKDGRIYGVLLNWMEE